LIVVSDRESLRAISAARLEIAQSVRGAPGVGQRTSLQRYRSERRYLGRRKPQKGRMLPPPEDLAHFEESRSWAYVLLTEAAVELGSRSGPTGTLSARAEPSSTALALRPGSRKPLETVAIPHSSVASGISTRCSARNHTCISWQRSTAPVSRSFVPASPFYFL
jgi:hypothetical protein